MAITGTGVVDDPFLVHSYDEIKTAAGSHTGANDMYYIKLMNDIDCNEYGADFEWEGIELGNGSSYTSERKYNHLDLNGHTIKNIKIKSGNYLFYSSNTTSEIINGKLINVFGGGASGFSSNIYYTNVAIGTNMSGQNSGNSVFMGTTHFNCCSVYCICNTPLSRFIMSHDCKNTDFYIEMRAGFNDRWFLSGTIDGCRFQGYVKSNIQNNGTYNTVIKNSIGNIEYEYPFEQTHGTWNELFEYKNGSFNNIENSDVTLRRSDTAGVITRVDSTQLKNAIYCTNTVGFVVVPISD